MPRPPVEVHPYEVHQVLSLPGDRLVVTICVSWAGRRSDGWQWEIQARGGVVIARSKVLHETPHKAMDEALVRAEHGFRRQIRIVGQLREELKKIGR